MQLLAILVIFRWPVPNELMTENECNPMRYYVRDSALIQPAAIGQAQTLLMWLSGGASQNAKSTVTWHNPFCLHGLGHYMILIGLRMHVVLEHEVCEYLNPKNVTENM